MTRLQLLQNTLQHTKTWITAVTLTVLAAAVTVKTVLPQFTAAVFLAAVAVMAVNLFYAIATYYNVSLRSLVDTEVNPFTTAVIGIGAVTGFTASIYFSPVFAVIILGFIAGLAAIAFIDTVARSVTQVTHTYPPDQLQHRLPVIFFLVAGVAAVLGRAMLGVLPGIGEGFVIGGILAVWLVAAFLVALTVWKPTVSFRGVELVEIGAYLVWFLPISAGYVTYGVTVATSFATITVVPVVTALIGMIVVLAVLSAAVNRFGLQAIPMVNTANSGYVILYLLVAVTVVWLSTGLYTTTGTGILHMFRIALLVGAVIGIPQTLYKRYWLLENRAPWFHTTLSARRNGDAT